MRLVSMANSSNNPNIARQAYDTSQFAVNRANNVATGSLPNLNSRESSTYSVANTIAPRDYAVEGTKGYYCDPNPEAKINYIIYSTDIVNKESDFTLQAVYQRNMFLEEKRNVIMVPANTRSEFEDAWSNMGGNIDTVKILYHSSERSLIIEHNSSTEALSIDGKNLNGVYICDITKLTPQNINTVEIISCNGGNISAAQSQEGNVAQAFLKIEGVEKVIAYDGNVAFGDNSNIIGKILSFMGMNLYPRKSTDQSAFNTIVQTVQGNEREPEGKVIYFPDGTIEIVGW